LGPGKGVSCRETRGVAYSEVDLHGISMGTQENCRLRRGVASSGVSRCRGFTVHFSVLLLELGVVGKHKTSRRKKKGCYVTVVGAVHSMVKNNSMLVIWIMCIIRIEEN
jgi:hypothetical protein